MNETPNPIAGRPQKTNKKEHALPNFDFSGRTETFQKIKAGPPDPACRRIILTGSVRCGKSTLAEKLIHRLKEKNITMAGILARGLWKNNQREGFDLMDIRTGRLTPLARRSAALEIQNRNKIPFSFFEQGINAGYDALSVTACKNSSVIIVDEIGKLEARGLGWAPCLSPLLAIARALHIWIVRENLVDQICSIWPVDQTTVIHAAAPDALLNLINACVKES